MLAATDAFLYFFFGSRQELRGYHHIVTLGHITQGASHILFRCSQLIGNGRIEEVHAKVKRTTDDLTCRLLANRPRMLSDGGVAEAHASKADARHAQV